MFLHVSVILSTGECLLWGGVCSRGECLLLGGICSGGVSAPRRVSALGGLLWGMEGVCSEGSAPGGCLLWGVCSGGGGVCSWGVCFEGLVSQHALRQTPPGEMATAADGMHPTGMHSCCFLQLICQLLYPLDLIWHENFDHTSFFFNYDYNTLYIVQPSWMQKIFSHKNVLRLTDLYSGI